MIEIPVPHDENDIRPKPKLEEALRVIAQTNEYFAIGKMVVAAGGNDIVEFVSYETIHSNYFPMGKKTAQRGVGNIGPDDFTIASMNVIKNFELLHKDTFRYRVKLFTFLTHDVPLIRTNKFWYEVETVEFI